MPECSPNEADLKFIDLVSKEIKEYIAALDKIKIKDGLKIAMGISKLGNQYIQENKPWDLVKSQPARCGTVVAVALNLVKVLASLLSPYLPPTSDKIFAQLNLPVSLIEDTFSLSIPAGHSIGEPAVLFKKIEDVSEFRSKFGGQVKEAFIADIRGGVVQTVEDHPNDENLYVVKVDVGKEQRQAVARLRGVYKKEELIGKEVAMLYNLPPAEFKGVKSQGMLLVAEGKKGKETHQVLLHPEQQQQSWQGRQLVPEGTELHAKEGLPLKEFQKLDIRLVNGKVIYKQKFVVHTSDQDKIGLTAAGVTGTAKIK